MSTNINYNLNYENELMDSIELTDTQILEMISNETTTEAFNFLFSKDQILNDPILFDENEKEQARKSNANWFMCKDGEVDPVWSLWVFWCRYTETGLTEKDIKYKMLQIYIHWLIDSKIGWDVIYWSTLESLSNDLECYYNTTFEDVLQKDANIITHTDNDTDFVIFKKQEDHSIIVYEYHDQVHESFIYNVLMDNFIESMQALSMKSIINGDSYLGY